MKNAPSHPSTDLNLYSIIIPARNEEECLPDSINAIYQTLLREGIDHEILVVDDGSTDATWDVLNQLALRCPTLRPVQNKGPHGFGSAITYGFAKSRGDGLAIMMADSSDDPEDAVKYWFLMQQGAECVFGSRFMKGGQVLDYPRLKLLVNRAANLFIRLMFSIPLNDTTNAFKAYRRHVITGCEPLLAPHFNLTVELPLKAIVRGYSWVTTPISWRNRRQGESKLKIKEMGSRYFFICMYVWLEKYFSRGDYKRVPVSSARRNVDRPKPSRAKGTDTTQHKV